MTYFLFYSSRHTQGVPRVMISCNRGGGVVSGVLGLPASCRPQCIYSEWQNIRTMYRVSYRDTLGIASVSDVRTAGTALTYFLGVRYYCSYTHYSRKAGLLFVVLMFRALAVFRQPYSRYSEFELYSMLLGVCCCCCHINSRTKESVVTRRCWGFSKSKKPPKKIEIRLPKKMYNNR